MPPENLFEESADDTRTAIMEATYRALTEYGYAGLTIQRIADKFEKSKSLLYHHYDGKDDLLVDFLEFVLDYAESNVPRSGDEPAPRRLTAFLDSVFPPDPTTDDEFVGVFVQLRAQAVQDDAYECHFTQSDRYFRQHVAGIIEDGIEEGTFREVDAEQSAAFLVSLVNAALTERTTTDDPDALRAVRAEVDDYLETRLFANDRRRDR
ncbi:TetR/AcrR family transcriptional regulator [Halorussus aquaticus]|uniref:TetR/AcrR family transcriptional regulator n=1 Tax=Halorussus aquaticus TaxID=2953748 RepID=A0ABD5Q279_9EURY|nr:TetR/AcrR family transcriptional regulator [Halorussus aquaticus]